MQETSNQDAINYQRIEHTIQYLSENFRAQPDLDELAAQVHLSPFHFQRMFTEWVGISPKKFLQYLTVDFLKNKLRQTRTLIEAAELAGLSSQSRVHDLFVTLEAVTPHEFRNGGANLEIEYGFHQTPFGRCLIAVTERGICQLSFLSGSDPAQELNALQHKWENAQLSSNQISTGDFTRQIFSGNNSSPAKIRLLVAGTNFQVKVWEALLCIPSGSVTTYQQIASAIGSPGAVRAVGTAVGRNPVAYLIPCHRVICKEGQPGQYHWGATRKKALVGWEMAKAEMRENVLNP